MKRLSLFLIIVLPAIGYAQHKVIDKAILECRYQETVVLDTLSMRKVTDTLYLKVGETAWSFYSKDLYFTDSLSMTNAGKHRLHELMFEYARCGRINELTSNTGEYLYMNYPEGYMTVRANMSGTGVEFVEEMECPKWNLTGDEKIIQGYRCNMAEADFRGRKWVAWFATDIPVSAGPWKLYGLPGLIVNAYDSDRHYEYMMVSLVSENCGDIFLLDMKKKYRKTTRMKYLISMSNSVFLQNEYIGKIEGLESLKSSRHYDYRERDY